MEGYHWNVVPLRRSLLAAALLLLTATPVASAARPDEDGAGVFGQANWTVDEAPASPLCTPRACVHWVATTGDAPASLVDSDADGAPDSVEYALDGLERGFRRMVAPEPGGLGWRRPLGDGALGGGTDVVDLYVKDLHDRAAGVAPVDSTQAPDRRPRYHGHIIIDDDLLAAGSWGFLQRKLVPHELQHLIEFAYDGWFESWQGESTAEWSVAQSDRSFELFSGYPPAWGAATELPMIGIRDPEDHFPPPKAYSSVIWQRWLEHRHGARMIRGVWERAAEASPASFVPSLIDGELAGRSTFFDEFVDFAVGHAEWRLAGSGFGGDAGAAEVERVATLAGGDDPATVSLDHTTFALYDVPVADAEALELRARAPEGTRAAVALVGRVGDPVDGRVEVQVQRLPQGGEARVGLGDASRFSRVTAVLVNADVTLNDPPKLPRSYEWSFARDGQPFSARVLRTDRPPPPPDEVESPLTVQPSVTEEPPESPPVIADDLVAPRLALARLPRRALRRLRAGRALALRATVDEASTVTAELRAGATVIRKVTVRVARAGPRMVAFRLTTAARRRLARAPRGRRVTLLVTARDAAGNARVVRRRLR